MSPSRVNINTIRTGRGFTLVELIVVAGMIFVLIAIFIPYAASLRESRNRLLCAENLRQINNALLQYVRDDSQHCLPRVVYDVDRSPNSWVAFTGPDCDDPFLDGATVRPNDVTASLWLLVRTQKISPKVFICPGTDDRADQLLSDQGKRVAEDKRGNFRGPGNLSYAYANPFSAVGYQSEAHHSLYYPLIADRGPGPSAAEYRVESRPLVLANANSRNHSRGGQNVLYYYGGVEFMSTPYCGDGWVWGNKAKGTIPSNGDNIYTALRPLPLATGEVVPPTEPGVLGPNVAPAWRDDGYLVPYEK